MRDALAAAALTAAVLTSATLAVSQQHEEGGPDFPDLSAQPAPPLEPEPSAPVPAPAPAPAPKSAPNGSGAPAKPRAPKAPTVAVGRQVVFLADYETGDFSQWGTCQSAQMNGSCGKLAGDSAMKIVRTDSPGGKYAAQFTVRDGDVPEFGGGERSEVSEHNEGAETREGDERWYEWSMRLPEDFRAPGGGWFIVMQWHAGSGSPPLAIDLSQGNVDIGGDGTDAPRRTIGPLRRGEWVNYVLHVKFSRSDDGYVEAWENGKKTVPLFHRATMSSSENYLKQGIYRDDNAGDGTTQIEFGGLRVTAP